MGVHTVFVNHVDEVVFLYIGDMTGADNVRRASSSDGGWTFAFESDNVLGDRALDSTMKFVDPKILLLPDGSFRLITMRRGENGPAPRPGEKAVGEVVTFISRNGRDFAREPGVRLSWADFTEFVVWSLNDPVLVRLSDARYRIYVAALVDDTGPDAPTPWKWVNVSATSR